MALRVVGAGLPRTATSSLHRALELLLGGRCYQMDAVFAHLEDVPVWRGAIRGAPVDWTAFPPDCVAAVDWPTSVLWRELAAAQRSGARGGAGGAPRRLAAGGGLGGALRRARRARRRRAVPHVNTRADWRDS